MKMASVRPIQCSFNPAPRFSDTETDHHVYSILSRDNENSITVNPLEHKVSSFSTFPICRQGVHWPEAEQSIKQFLDTLVKLAHLTGASLPKKFTGTADMIESVTETTVACTTYLIPNATSRRAVLIAQSMVLVWLQDDVTEFSPEQIGKTVSDVALGLVDGGDLPGLKNDSNVSFVEEISNEDEVLGKEVIDETVAFLRYRGPQQASIRYRFANLNDYLEYRSGDIALYYNFAIIKFARGITLTDKDRTEMKAFENIAANHIILVQDLYSFERERRETEQDPSVPLINAVAVLKKLLGTDSYATAINVVRDMIIQAELDAKQEFKRLRQQGSLNENQLSYVEGIFEFNSGHLYFAATAPRYNMKKPGPGGEIPPTP